MEITPLAFDSLGVRSMATLVETKELKIMIDPGAALGPSRYNLPPHKKEWDRLDKLWKEIKNNCRKCDVMIVTHYHYDHHDPNEPDIYEGKKVFLKHPTDNINKSQKTRANYFLKQLEGIPEKIEFSDGKKFMFGKTKIEFSKAVPHGANNKLGYLTEVLVDDGKEKLVHTSDVEGPSLDEQVKFILENRPNYLILDGPLSYMLGYRYSQASLDSSIDNMIKVIRNCPLKNFVIDHHFLRDLKWREKAARAIEFAEKKKIPFQTAAEFCGRKIEMLEALRNKLYKGE